MQPPFCTFIHLLLRNYKRADYIARSTARAAYRRVILSISQRDIDEYINKITGGLGYLGKPGKDDYRVITLGCYIAWAEVALSAEQILEIGTGLGRTHYCIRYVNKNAVIHSIEVDPIMLGIALYRNPYQYFAESLKNKNTFIFLNDATIVTQILLKNREKYKHIVHDGGPNPKKNMRLYSYRFLNTLYKLLDYGGTISVFAGKNPEYIRHIYRTMEKIGFKKLETITPPGISVRIIRGRKH